MRVQDLWYHSYLKNKTYTPLQILHRSYSTKFISEFFVRKMGEYFWRHSLKLQALIIKNMIYHCRLIWPIASVFSGVPAGEIFLKESIVSDSKAHFASSEDTVIVFTESSSTTSSITVQESKPDKTQVNNISSTTSIWFDYSFQYHI